MFTKGNLFFYLQLPTEGHTDYKNDIYNYHNCSIQVWKTFPI